MLSQWLICGRKIRGKRFVDAFTGESEAFPGGRAISRAIGGHGVDRFQCGKNVVAVGGKPDSDFGPMPGFVEAALPVFQEGEAEGAPDRSLLVPAAQIFCGLNSEFSSTDFMRSMRASDSRSAGISSTA